MVADENDRITEFQEKPPVPKSNLALSLIHILQTYVKTLNAFYKEHPAFWQVDYSWEGFQWIVPDDSQQSVIAFLRKDTSGKQILVVCNFCLLYTSMTASVILFSQKVLLIHCFKGFLTHFSASGGRIRHRPEWLQR